MTDGRGRTGRTSRPTLGTRRKHRGTGKCPRNRGSQQDGEGEADEWPDDETLCIIKRINRCGSTLEGSNQTQFIKDACRLESLGQP